MVGQLETIRPDRGSAVRRATKDVVKECLLQKNAQYPDLTNLDVIMMTKVKYTIEHPESVSLGEIGKLVSVIGKDEGVGDASSNLLNIFVRFDDKAEEVIDPKDKEEE